MTAIAPALRDIARRTRRLDRAWLAVALIAVAILALDAAQFARSLRFTGESLVAIAPFLALAVALAVGARASGADGLIARAFQGRLATMIAVAALFGGLSPFCSCGVIPLIAALLAMGVPLPAVMAFWLSSPLMDPSMFVLTVATLGLGFAVAKTVAAIGIGMAGGFATLALMNGGAFADPLRPGVGDGGCGGAKVRRPGPVVWTFWRDAKRRQSFAAEASRTVLFLGKWLTLAFVLESLMLAWVPADAIAGVVGPDSLWAIPIAVVVGVPAYLNGYAALPLVAGLLDMGVAPGAGMAFLIAGGVTSIPAAVAVWALVRRPVFLWYIVLSMAGGLAAGILYQAFAG
ncbi:MAG: permease [Rhodospirillales bacterium]|nr:permease [Rhodospirillales bacterium]